MREGCLQWGVSRSWNISLSVGQDSQGLSLDIYCVWVWMCVGVGFWVKCVGSLGGYVWGPEGCKGGHIAQLGCSYVGQSVRYIY